MGFTNCLTIGQMKEWDILDEVPYKYFKNCHDEDDIEVNIYHIEDEDNRPTYSTVVFEYGLEYDCSAGSLPLYTTKKFKTKITYNSSSYFALFLCNICEDDEDENEDEEDKDEEDKDEEEDEEDKD
jgi:hypothetical protein